MTAEQDDQTKGEGFDMTGAEPPDHTKQPRLIEYIGAPFLVLAAIISYYTAKRTGAFEDDI